MKATFQKRLSLKYSFSGTSSRYSVAKIREGIVISLYSVFT